MHTPAAGTSALITCMQLLHVASQAEELAGGRPYFIKLYQFTGDLSSPEGLRQAHVVRCDQSEMLQRQARLGLTTQYVYKDMDSLKLYRPVRRPKYTWGAQVGGWVAGWG